MGSLTLEDPWLAAALSDGTVALLNTEVAMRQRHHGRPSSASLPPRRVFQLPGGAAYCADLADQWLIAGSGQCVQVKMLSLFGSSTLNLGIYDVSNVCVPFLAVSACTRLDLAASNSLSANSNWLHLFCGQPSSRAHLKIWPWYQEHESAVRQPG